MSSALVTVSGTCASAFVGIPAGVFSMIGGYAAGGIVYIAKSYLPAWPPTTVTDDDSEALMNLGSVAAPAALIAGVELLSISQPMIIVFQMSCTITSLYVSSWQGEEKAKEKISLVLKGKIKKAEDTKIDINDKESIRARAKYAASINSPNISTRWFFRGMTIGGTVAVAAKVAAYFGAGAFTLPVGIAAGLVAAHEVCKRGNISYYTSGLGLKQLTSSLPKKA